MEQPKILIVDDEPFNVDFLEQELEDLGYDTISASNGQEALDTIDADPPDLILLDIMMPVMDGFGVLARLRDNRRWRDIPTIVISALNDLDSIVRGIELGAIDYLSKPFNPVILQARINAGLEKKQLRDQEVAYLAQVEILTDAAREVQNSDFDPDSLAAVANRPDALGNLARVFQQMAREVYAREEKLKQEVQTLKIELDRARQDKQVEDITGTDYFQELESKAKLLRSLFDDE